MPVAQCDDLPPTTRPIGVQQRSRKRDTDRSNVITDEAVLTMQPITPTGLLEPELARPSATSLIWSPERRAVLEPSDTRSRGAVIVSPRNTSQTSMTPLDIARHRRRMGSSRVVRREGEFSSAHLVGICGSGMKALAEMLSGLGWRVTGSDLHQPGPSVRTIEKLGLRIHQGHNDRFLPPDTGVLV